MMFCQHCGSDLSDALSSYPGARRRSGKRPVRGTLAGQLGGHPIDFCNDLCRDQWDRLEGRATNLDGHRWTITPAQVFEPGDGAEVKCSCGFSHLGGEIEVGRSLSAHLHSAAAEIERLEFRQRQAARERR